MKTIRTLHLASFDGNIGDNANHNGMYGVWEKYLDLRFDVKELEIREFHWKQRFFDQDLVELFNSYDLVVIGGGNYFELWVERSRTGTTIDLPVELLSKIETPIFFNALGCDPYKGASEANVVKFKKFLDFTSASEKFFLTVRNDGSMKNIRRHLGEKYLGFFTEIPDGGFFVNVEDHYHHELKNDSINIAINLAGDMPEFRYPTEYGYADFVKEFSSFMADLSRSERGVNFVFVPHIFRDLSVIADVLALLQDDIRRRHVSVAPYLHGPGSEKIIFDLYKKADLAMGMRFHANVCPIGLGTPSVALLTYPKVSDLLEEIGLQDRSVVVNERGFSKMLFEKTMSSLRHSKEIREQYFNLRGRLDDEMSTFMRGFSSWLSLKV
jgi:polysaccharide pyruvyl transferase WcaK-like protein